MQESLNKEIKVGAKEYVHDITALTYKKLNHKKRKQYRLHLKNKLEAIFKAKINEAVQRYLAIADLQVVEKKIFNALIDQAKLLYIEGYYYSTVALCGVIGENICRIILEDAEILINNKKLSAKKQFTRLDFSTLNKILITTNLINQESYKNLERVRKLRNDYVHGKGLSNINKCRNHAKNALNYIISILNMEFKPEV